MSHRTAGTALVFLAVAAAVAVIHQGDMSCQAQENVVSLSQLTDVSINANSSAAADLLDPSFWSEVNAASGQTIRQLAPQTILGFLNSSADWRDWLGNNSVNSPSAPSWLHDGFLAETNSQVFQLGSATLGSRNAEQAATTIQSFAASVSSYTLAAVDYASLNGLTSLRTYTYTGSIDEAICVSFPGQLAQLFDDSTDDSLPSPLRAQYLGQAMAITELTLLLSGSDGLNAKLSDALSRTGLSTSWDTIKPYLSDFGTKVSAKASFLTLSLAEELAHRFPQNSVWVTGLTSDRVDSMAEGLQEEGYPDTAIEQKIAGLVQAAGDASNPDDVAIDADVIRYQAGAGLQVHVGSQSRIYEYSDGKTEETIQARFLQQVVPGFQVGKAVILSVDFIEKNKTVYQGYNGGPNWTPTARSDVAQEGDVLTLTMEILTPEGFANDLPAVSMVNHIDANWVADETVIGNFALEGNDFSMTLTQDPEVDGVSVFTVHGTAAPILGFLRGDAYLQFGVTDVFGNVRQMRIYFDGYTQASFGIQSGTHFLPVALFSDDGVRLKVGYDAGTAETTYKIATIYESNPSSLYAFGAVDYTDLPVMTAGALTAFQIDQVTFTRPLEQSMFEGGVPYDIARLGVEIAYKVGTENLGLKDLVIVEPSQIGPDLITQDETVVVQARFLKVTNLYTQQQLQDALQQNLQDMSKELKSDFKVYSAHMGVIVLSYTDSQGAVDSIVLEIQRPP